MALAHIASDLTTLQLIANSLLKWAKHRSEALLVHEDPKGAITRTSNRQSTLPYVNLETLVIETSGKRISLTNTGRSLLLISDPSASFPLTLDEKFFFLIDILRYDRASSSLLALLFDGKVLRKKIFVRIFLRNMQLTYLTCEYIADLQVHYGK